MVFIVYPVSLDRWVIYVVDVDRMAVVEIRDSTPAQVCASFVVE